MKRKIIVATRGSRLAKKQSEIIMELLCGKFPEIEIDILEVVTRGDADQETPLSGFGNSGVFVKSIEQKLLNGEADLAVHSLKDVPTGSHPDLILAAFPEREDERDVLVASNGETWMDLKPGSIVGTSSPARQQQLKLLRPDLKFKNIRGNVDTRVQKVLSGEYDATILAAAGLKRLSYEIDNQSFFTLDEMVPSPGQGTLVIQIKKNNLPVMEIARKLNNITIEKQVLAERMFMQVIGGGCRYPVAAHVEIYKSKAIFRAIALKPGFNKLKKVKHETTLKNIFEVAEQIASEMLKNS